MAPSNTTEIPKEQWSTYLDRISADHRDRSVEVEIVGPDLGDQTLVRHAELRGLSLAMKGESAGSVELDLGVEGGGLDHRVFHPAHLYAVEADRGLSVLEIEDDARNKTLIRFSKPGLLGR